jgi:hypothetical protein
MIKKNSYWHGALAGWLSGAAVVLIVVRFDDGLHQTFYWPAAIISILVAIILHTIVR